MPSIDNDPIRVAIVDDHVLVAQALRQLLERNGEFEVVGIAVSAEDGLRTITQTTPDVVLMDVRLPDGNGIDLVRRIRATTSATKVLVLTVSDDPVTVAQAMDAGIHGYLVKSSDATHLVAAIRTAHEGGLYFDEPARKAYEAWSKDPHVLSETEAQMLRLVAKGADQKAVADAMSISVSTLKRSLQSLARKLDAANATDAAFEAVRRGLI